jgi:hypothetical protein
MPPARLLAGLAVCAVALAACGFSSKPSSSGSADTQAVKYADCLRTHGMPNFPDPNSNGANGPSPLPAPTRAAAQACAKLQPSGMHLHGPPVPSAAELRAALVFARCMRAHGVSHFPDPLTTLPYVTSLTLGPGEYFPLSSPTEAQSPAFRHAAKACGLQLPTGPP